MKTSMTDKSTTISDAAVADLVDRLRSTFEPCRIYLFGSRATGRERPDSDFDCLVIVPNTTESHFQRQVRSQAVLSGFPYCVDVLVYTESEWNEMSLKRYSVARQVRDQGRLVHAA